MLRPRKPPLAEATVKVEVAGEKTLHTRPPTEMVRSTPSTAPCARCSAFHPVLDAVHLVDYKVRILDGGTATAARTRVIIDSQDGSRTWSTMAATPTSSRNLHRRSRTRWKTAIGKSGAELRRRDERHFTTSNGGGDDGGGGGGGAASPVATDRPGGPT